MKNSDAFRRTTITHLGREITIEWFFDQDMGPPWKENDGHGPVSEWTRRDKKPGERVLCVDRFSKRYYDYAEAIRIARRDGWDAPPYNTGTKGQQAVRAVEADFKYLQRWCGNRWWWCGYIVTIQGYEDQYPHNSLWGIESDAIPEWEEETLESAKVWLEIELAESERAACSDILTV